MMNDIPNELKSLFKPEFETNNDYLSLSANENVISNTAAKFLSSTYADKYYFKSNNGRFSDFPGFVASGSKDMDEAVGEAQEALCNMTGASYVNLFPLSGIHAMLMTIVSLTKPGDTVLSLPPDECGHFATKSIVEEMGRKSIYIPTSDGDIDIEGLSKLLSTQRIKLIYFDLMSHIETVDIKAVKSLASKGTLIVYDASHTLGLILGKQFQDPFLEGADVLCANTHKTFPGPHRGVILAKDASLGEKIESVVSGKFYSSVHYGTLLAMLITIFEIRDFGNTYAKQVVYNANDLAKKLETRGASVAHCKNGAYTKNHQIHILFENREKARTALELLRDSDIVAHLCFRESTGYFIRLGTQEITRKGIDDMDMIADLIISTMNGEKNDMKVKELVSMYPNKYFSYDAI